MFFFVIIEVLRIIRKLIIIKLCYMLLIFYKLNPDS